VKCQQCGAEFDEGAKRCSDCGASAADASPTPSPFQGTQQASEKQKKQLLGMALAAGSIICLLVLFFSMGSDEKKKQDNGGRSATASDGGTSISNSTSAPVTFPTLHFASSGRLPIKLHRLQLGMSAAEAMAEDSSLKDFGTDKSPLSDPGASLCCGSFPKGFDDSAGLSEGRIISVGSDVRGISPEDALRFNKDTLGQLGKPDVEVYAGSSTTVWVWIDGDVRIRYQNAPDGRLADKRDVGLEMAVYPELIKNLQNLGDKGTFYGDTEAAAEKHTWGENAGQDTIKQLPSGPSDVKFQMTPWQLRSALPGIELKRGYPDPERRQTGDLDTSNVTTGVSLWDGLVCTIYKGWNDVPADQIPEMRRHLIDEFGTPSNRMPAKEMESITWEDDHTKIDYLFGPRVERGGRSFVQVQAWYRDKRPDALYFESAESASPSESKPSPETYSFF
jgi:hypothetical protein